MSKRLASVPITVSKRVFSAYEEAVNNGFEGTQSEWLESLKGDPPKVFDFDFGATSYDRDDRGSTPTEVELITNIQGYTGEPTWDWDGKDSNVRKEGSYLIIPSNFKGGRITVTMSLEGVAPISKTIYEINKTSAPYCIAVVTEQPVAQTSFNGIKCIASDTVVYNQKPYRYTGSAWQLVNSLSDLSYEEASNIGQTVITSGVDIKDSTSAIYGYFQNLYAQSALFESVRASDYKVEKCIRGGGYDVDGNLDGDKGFYLDSDGTLRAISAKFLGGFASDGFSTGTASIVPTVRSTLKKIKYIGSEQNKQVVAASAFIDGPGYFAYTVGYYKTSSKTVTASSASPIYVSSVKNKFGLSITILQASAPITDAVHLYTSDDNKWITNQAGTSSGWFEVSLDGGVSMTSVTELYPPVSTTQSRVSDIDGTQYSVYRSSIGRQDAMFENGYFGNMVVGKIKFLVSTATLTSKIMYHYGSSMTSVPDASTDISGKLYIFADGTSKGFMKDPNDTWRIEYCIGHGTYEFWLVYRSADRSMGTGGSIDAIKVPLFGLSDGTLSSFSLDTAVFQAFPNQNAGKADSNMASGGTYMSVVNCSMASDSLTMHFYTGYSSSGGEASFNRPVTIYGRFRTEGFRN